MCVSHIGCALDDGVGVKVATARQESDAQDFLLYEADARVVANLREFGGKGLVLLRAKEEQSILAWWGSLPTRR